MPPNPCFCVFDCCFIQQFHSTTPLAKLTRNSEKSLVPTLCDFCDLVECHFELFSVRLTVSEVLKSFWDCPGVVSTTCCHCDSDIIWCVRDIILCDSLFKSSALHLFTFMTSSSATRSFNHLAIICSRS